jgi:hypothetical protein
MPEYKTVKRMQEYKTVKRMSEKGKQALKSTNQDELKHWIRLN